MCLSLSMYIYTYIFTYTQYMCASTSGPRLDPPPSPSDPPFPRREEDVLVEVATKILGVEPNAEHVESKLLSLWKQLDGQSGVQPAAPAPSDRPPLGMSQQAYDQLKECVQGNQSFGTRSALGSQFARWLGGEDTNALNCPPPSCPTHTHTPRPRLLRHLHSTYHLHRLPPNNHPLYLQPLSIDPLP